MRSGRLYTRKKGQEGPGLFGSDGQKPSSMQKPGSMKVAKGVSTREKQKPTKPSTTHQHTSGASNNTVDRKQLSCGPGPQHQISCRGFCAQRGHNAHFCRTRSQSRAVQHSVFKPEKWFHLRFWMIGGNHSRWNCAGTSSSKCVGTVLQVTPSPALEVTRCAQIQLGSPTTGK